MSDSTQSPSPPKSADSGTYAKAFTRTGGRLKDEWTVQPSRYRTLDIMGQMSDDRLISLPAMAG